MSTNPPAYRVAYLVSHPIQYQAPLLRYIVAHSDIELTAFFLSDFSVKSYQDEGFGTAVQWDVPLLDGYPSEVLPALGDNQRLTSLRPFVYGLAQASARRAALMRFGCTATPIRRTCAP